MESEAAFSARLEISMCNFLVSDAESHGALLVAIGDEEKRFIGSFPSSPWFADGSTHVYEFLVGGDVKDIQKISIRTESSNDPFCLARVRLGVNHFTRGTATWNWVFDTDPMERRVDAGETLTYSFEDLRSSSDWRWSNFAPISVIGDTGLGYETLEDLLQGLFEEAIRGNEDVVWDYPGAAGELVTARPGDLPREAKIHVELAKSHRRLLDNIDVNFLLRASCPADTSELSIEPDNFTVNTEGIFGGRVWERRVENSIGGMAADFSEMVTLPEPYDCNGLSAIGSPEFDLCGLRIGLTSAARQAGQCP